MNISKFLLIDSALLISSIPFLLLLQGENKKFPLLRSSNKEKPLEKTTYELPTKAKLLDLEKITRSQGSGIEFDSLVGDWKFASVWKNDHDDKDSVFSSLLRVFSANLELKKDISTENPLGFSVVTSIKFGLFTIEFSGSGDLQGKQPLLSFILNRIELKSGSSILLSRSLKKPVKNEKSFFALIASEENGGWLSARGQGGALILWLKK